MNTRENNVKEHKRVKTALKIIQSGLIVLLIILVVLMMFQINNLQGTARVINYAGLVRGATQREVKLEITGCPNDELIKYLDDILSGLKYEDGNYELVSLDDADYLSKLDKQIDYWGLLKGEIARVRESGYETTDIVRMSEEYFVLADETVSAAEAYSDRIARYIKLLEIISAVDMLVLLWVIVSQYVAAAKMSRRAKLLEQKAYIDVHTGLPNKSKCEELFMDFRFLVEPTACIMFDLNNLKQANDTMGHSAGDQLIANFARILRNAVPAKDFVGRYGGDEFVVVLYQTDKDGVLKVIEKLYEEVREFNGYGRNIPVSFAYGWALSTEYKDCTLRTLFDKADQYMYKNKQRGKKQLEK